MLNCFVIKRYTIFFFVFVCLVIKRGKGSDEKPWLKKIETDKNCEVCQVITDILVKEIEKKRNVWENKRGMLDILLQTEFLEPNYLCSFGLWKDYAEKTPDLHVYDMTATCKVMLGEDDEVFEQIPQLLKKKKKIREILEDICKIKSQICKNVWTENDMPELRKEKKILNLENAVKFLEYNKKQEGIIETKSGLQYKILRKKEKKDDEELSKKKKVTSPNDVVQVKYKGMHLNGEIFDESNSATFVVTQVISGWREGMELMNVGDVYKLYIPPQLGYGSNSAGNKIGPNSALIFEVELLDVRSTEKEVDGSNGNETKNESEVETEKLKKINERINHNDEL